MSNYPAGYTGAAHDRAQGVNDADSGSDLVMTMTRAEIEREMQDMLDRLAKYDAVVAAGVAAARNAPTGKQLDAFLDAAGRSYFSMGDDA